jgi:hypothetical protein
MSSRVGDFEQPDSSFSCDLVIARYKETLSWLPKYDEYNFRNVIIYNKGDNDGLCPIKKSPCNQIMLKNEGRCDHTYLWHIINNYDNLADVTVFCKGSSDMHRERKKLPFTIKKVFETHDTVMSVSIHPKPIHIDAENFQLDQYQSSNPQNRSSPEMKKATIRPFGKWYKAHFPGMSTRVAVYSGIFAVSRTHIHQRPKGFYEKMIKELEGHPNPEAGHYFERSWVTIFHPIPQECLYHDILHEGFSGGGSSASKRGTGISWIPIVVAGAVLGLALATSNLFRKKRKV